MNVHLHRRAEIALRSLREDERRRVSSVIRSLEDEAEPHGLAAEPEGGLSVVQAGPELRLVLSLADGAISVEDIVPTERLKGIAGRPPA